MVKKNEAQGLQHTDTKKSEGDQDPDMDSIGSPKQATEERKDEGSSL